MFSWGRPSTCVPPLMELKSTRGLRAELFVWPQSSMWTTRSTRRVSEYFAPPREDLKKSGVSGGMNFKKWLCWRPEECPAVNSWTAEETNSTCEHSNKAVLLCYSTSLGVYVRAWLFTPQTSFFPRLHCGCTVTVCCSFVFHSLPWTLSNALSCFRLALNRCAPHCGLILSDSGVHAAAPCARRNW